MKNGLILVVMVAMFALSSVYINADTLVVILNGVFVGSIVAFLFVLRTLTWATFRGKIKYPDVSMFTLGLLLVLFGICSGVATSIYIKASDLAVPVFTLTALARYSVICGIMTMAYAPGAGGGFLEGSDRKVVLLSVASGIVAALVTIYVQSFAVLA
jgi:hypothetical protein